MINSFFESQMAWKFDNGVFFITGRDIACVIAGICVGIIFALLVQYAKYLETEYKKYHKQAKWKREFRKKGKK